MVTCRCTFWCFFLFLLSDDVCTMPLQYLNNIFILNSTIVFLVYMVSVFSFFTWLENLLKSDFRSVVCPCCWELVSYVCQKLSLMWAVYLHSYWLVMMDVLLDKVMHLVFLPLQPPASLHKATLRGCSADIQPQQETALSFMSLRTASIY